MDMRQRGDELSGCVSLRLLRLLYTAVTEHLHRVWCLFVFIVTATLNNFEESESKDMRLVTDFFCNLYIS